MGVTLGAVADYRNGFALDERKVGVFVVIDFHVFSAKLEM
jgi:hypothetical protein